MRKQILSITFVIIGFIISSNLNVQAQADSALKMEVTFDFYVGNEKLPAGEYSVKRLGINSFSIRNLNNKTTVIAVASLMFGIPNESRIEKVVFNLYGEEHFLSEIWSEPATLGRGLYKSKKEKQSAKSTYWGKAKQPQKVEVAMSVFRP